MPGRNAPQARAVLMPSPCPACLPQLVPGEGDPVTRPLKVEEGLLLSVLEAAANKGHVPVAEAAWRLLERSLALPNPPSSWGALSTHVGRAAQLEQEEAQEEGARADGLLAADAEAAWEGSGDAAGDGAAPPLDQLSAELEAAHVGAAEMADAEGGAAQQQGQQQRQGGGGGGRRREAAPALSDEWVELAREEARALAAQRRGTRAPSLLSHLALVHTYARAGEFESMFRAVARVEEVGAWGAMGTGHVDGGMGRCLASGNSP